MAWVSPGLEVASSVFIHNQAYFGLQEVTMQLLRDNKDPLMNVLHAFIHGPLVEWEDEKRKVVRSMACLSPKHPDENFPGT
jgi:phosphatidylinositol kinase/protein kinase (PI-3  family)